MPLLSSPLSTPLPQGFNRTGFVVVSLLVERWRMTVDAALDAFAKARPPGVKHERFRVELHNRYGAHYKSPAPSGHAEAQGLSREEGEDEWRAPGGVAVPCAACRCSCMVYDSAGGCGSSGCSCCGGSSPVGVTMPLAGGSPLGGCSDDSAGQREGISVPRSPCRAILLGRSPLSAAGGGCGSTGSGGCNGGSDGDNSSIGGSVGGSPDVGGGAMHLVAEVLGAGRGAGSGSLHGLGFGGSVSGASDSGVSGGAGGESPSSAAAGGSWRAPGGGVRLQQLQQQLRASLLQQQLRASLQQQQEQQLRVSLQQQQKEHEAGSGSPGSHMPSRLGAVGGRGDGVAASTSSAGASLHHWGHVTNTGCEQQAGPGVSHEVAAAAAPAAAAAGVAGGGLLEAGRCGSAGARAGQALGAAAAAMDGIR